MIQGGVPLQAGDLVKGFWQYLLARLQVRAEMEKERLDRMVPDDLLSGLASSPTIQSSTGLP